VAANIGRSGDVDSWLAETHEIAVSYVLPEAGVPAGVWAAGTGVDDHERSQRPCLAVIACWAAFDWYDGALRKDRAPATMPSANTVE
jgi:hypothetical protein